MPLSLASILAEIDAALVRYDEVEKAYIRHTDPSFGPSENFLKMPESVAGEIITTMRATIDRLGPPGYGTKAMATVPKDHGWESKTTRILAGILKSLRADYAAGRMQTFQERVHSDLFSDFLEMAEYLLEDDGLKDPAAVLAGGVLEEHLRKLCAKHIVPLSPKPKLEVMNADLKKQGVYGGNEQKQVTAWAAIRNSAAHAQYADYTAEQVRLMLQGLRHFLGSYPA